MAEVATYDEKPTEADREVQRWCDELKLAEEAEKNWRADAKRAIDIYRNEGKQDRRPDHSSKETFNILWANVEIKGQAIYSAEPRPNIRRRHRDRDPLGKAVSELLERAITYTIDCEDIDSVLNNNVNDMLLPGRGIARLRYKSDFETDEEGNETDEVAYEQVIIEHVQWNDFIRGPGKTWDEVPWIAFKHRMPKDQVKSRFGEKFAEAINYDVTAYAGDDKDDDGEKTVFNRALIYEIWDKENREVLWIANGYKDTFLDRQDDPMSLKGFWPIPKPLYAIESSTSLEPICEYSQYSILAGELEKVSKRRNKIADAIRVRGVHDSTITELERVFESDDNQFIPATNLSQLIERGGLEKAIWMLPIEQLVNVYQILGQQRTELIQQIYEITGISDIIRGDTNPNETLGAQQIKANFGSLRLERQKQAVQKYARDIVEVMAEVIAENFSRETLSVMTGMSFPTQADQDVAKQQMALAQQRLQALQQAGQGQPQNMAAYGVTPQQVQQQTQQAQQILQQSQQVLEQPTWESIEEVLQDDFLREFRVDIETDSTIAVDVQKDQQNLTEYMNGMGNFTRYAAEAVGTGLLTMPAAKKMMVQFARKFELGREVEDELEESADQSPQPSAEQQQAQAETQMEREKHQMEMQQKQVDMQQKQQEAQFKAMEARMDMMMQKLELDAKREETELEIKEAEAKYRYDVKKQQLELKNAREKYRFDAEKRELQKQEAADGG